MVLTENSSIDAPCSTDGWTTIVSPSTSIHGDFWRNESIDSTDRSQNPMLTVDRSTMNWPNPRKIVSRLAKNFISTETLFWLCVGECLSECSSLFSLVILWWTKSSRSILLSLRRTHQDDQEHWWNRKVRTILHSLSLVFSKETEIGVGRVSSCRWNIFNGSKTCSPMNQHWNSSLTTMKIIFWLNSRARWPTERLFFWSTRRWRCGNWSCSRWAVQTPLFLFERLCQFICSESANVSTNEQFFLFGSEKMPIKKEEWGIFRAHPKMCQECELIALLEEIIRRLLIKASSLFCWNNLNMPFNSIHHWWQRMSAYTIKRVRRISSSTSHGSFIGCSNSSADSSPDWTIDQYRQSCSILSRRFVTSSDRQIDQHRQQTQIEKKRLACWNLTLPVAQVQTGAGPEEDTDDFCCICWGGYRDFPKKLLAIYTLTKNIDLEPFEAKWHISLSFIRHIEQAWARDEWESALLPLRRLEVTSVRDTSPTSAIHDVKLCLLRFADLQSFDEYTSAGGRESNLRLIFPIKCMSFSMFSVHISKPSHHRPIETSLFFFAFTSRLF